MSQQFIAQADTSESPHNHTDAVWSVRWSGSGAVVSAGADGQLKIWDGPTAEYRHTLQPSPLALVSLSTSPHPTAPALALTNSLDGTVALVDLEAGLTRARLEAQEGFSPWRTALHPSTSHYAASSSSPSSTYLSVHSTSTLEPQTPEDPVFGAPLGALEMGKPAFVMSLEYSPDGRYLVAGTQTGQAYVFDVSSGSLLRVFSAHSTPLRALSFSPDSTLLYTSSDSTLTTIHDLRHPSTIATLPPSQAHSSWVLDLAAAPDSKLLASAGADRQVKIWDIAQRAVVSTLMGEGEVQGVDWRPLGVSGGAGVGGQGLVSAGEEGVVRWWKSASG